MVVSVAVAVVQGSVMNGVGGISGAAVGESVTNISGVSLSISGPLAKTLGRSGDIGSGISGVSGDTRSVVVSGKVGKAISRFSGPLSSQTLGRSGDVGGSGSGVASNARSVVVSTEVGKAVAIISRFSGSLATAAETGGGRVGGGNSGPVGVGVVEDGGVAVVGIGLGGGQGDG